MYGLSGFVENLNSTNMLNEQNRVNSMETCVHQMYILSRFAENFNIHNCVNSTRNCVQQMYGFSRFA